jgi:transcriptional regulator with XRE-family HTH domain
MKLQDIRKRVGLSQSELAKRSGIKLQTIQGYELGRRQIDGAHVDTLVSMADALGVPFYELIEDAQRIEKIKQNIKREV